MTARELLTRKMAAGLTDLQTLLLLVLAARELMTLSDLAHEVRRPIPSVSMAVRVLVEDGYVIKDTDRQPFALVFLYLSDAGKCKLAWLLGRGAER